MTQEDKELLLKDLSARLPYGVKCHYDVVVPMIGKVKSYDKLRAISEFDSKPCFQFGSNRDIFDFDNIKPYLFPLSSMTEEHSIYMGKNKLIIAKSETEAIMNPDGYDFLNKNHFDYRGLIEKGLAIDATGKGIY